MKSRFKAKPNISAARERTRSSSVDGRARVGSDSSLQTKTVAQSSSRVKGDRQDEGSSSGGESTQDHEVMPRMQPALPQYVVPCGVLSQSGQVESVRDKSSHIGGHFADKGVAPLEPLVEYSEDALGNEVMVESEASVVTGSALALSDNSGDEVQRTSFSSSVSIGNLIAESYALCRDGAVNGSEVLEHDSVQPERIAATVGGECEDAASRSEGTSECVERDGEVAQLSLCSDRPDERPVGTEEGQPLPPPDSVPADNMDTRKIKGRPHRKRPCPVALPKGKEKDKEGEEKEEESECISSPPPVKRSRRKSSRDKQVKVAPDLGKMTMAELISYNPSANPMQSAHVTKEKQQNGTRRSGRSKSVDGAREQEGVSDNVPLPPPPMPSATGRGERDGEGDGSVDGDGRLVPQLMVDKDGKIVVNENSMVVQSSRLDPEIAADKLETVYEIAGDFRPTTSGSTKRAKMKIWTEDETKVFYRALSQVGTDFTMMTLLVVGRTRGDLKKKFKKEEKVNPHKVNSALKRRIPITTTGPIRTA